MTIPMKVDISFRSKVDITFPTDVKLAAKVIDNCYKIAQKEGVKQSQTYKRVAKQHLRDAYFGHHPKKKKESDNGSKKITNYWI